LKSRRNFLLNGVTGISVAWAATHWPVVFAAAQHAHHSAQPGASPRFEYLTPELAAELDCMVARIIPTDETPGAREAGVVYFIDRALATFAKDDQNLYAEGMAEVQAKVRKMFPGVERFSSASQEQQDELLRTLEENAVYRGRPFASRPAAQGFFETLRQHTILGFVIDPDSDRLGNREAVGWGVIGREREHMFQPPFGHYDEDYPGWQPVAGDGGKK
jgi:hypothetical protein